MKNCLECNTENSMYDRRNDYRCIECGHTHKYKLVGDTVPTREQNSKCGDIISNYFEGVSRACVRKKVCTDGTTCSIKPTTTKHLKNGIYMVSCTFHKD